jgi:fatty acid desaturase
MSVQAGAVKAKPAKPVWYRAVSKYSQPNLRKAIWQLVNTFVPYLALWVLMVRTIQLGYSYWLTLALATVAAGLLVRIFIFFHDCCHGSFFTSRRANTILGYVTGILTFTPYEDWRRAHAGHHATAGDLDRRGVGDIWTLTVEEYLSQSPRHVWTGACVCVLPRPAILSPGSQEARALQCDIQQSGNLGHHRTDELDHQLPGLRPRPVAGHDHCRCHRRVALLRPAPV